MQKTYISTIYKLMKQDSNVISCLSDSGTDYDEIIARELPNQVINYGISENNKVASAAGLATFGKIPFVYTTNAFLAYRSYEFIRDDVCLQNKNVKLVGMGCGISWSTLGPTHHTTEDISALKVLPNLVLLSPASPKELEKCLMFSYEHKGPVYIRIGMGGEEEIYQDECKFELSSNNVINEGEDAVIFVTGSIASEVLKAVKMLEEDGLSLKVVNVCTLKPFNNKSVVKESKGIKKVISIEEHNVIGGLGSSVADAISEENIDAILYKIGINDRFAKGYGTYKEIKKMNELDSDSIYLKIKEILYK